MAYLVCATFDVVVIGSSSRDEAKCIIILAKAAKPEQVPYSVPILGGCAVCHLHTACKRFGRFFIEPFPIAH